MADLDRLFTTQIVINWGYGTSADTNLYNNVTQKWLTGSTVSITRGRTENTSLSPPRTETFECTLDNSQGEFSVVGGPLEGYVGRGPSIAVYITWNGNVDYNDEDVDFNDNVIPYDGSLQLQIFTGHIDTARQSSDGISTVQITGYGKYQELAAKKVTIPLLENTTIDAILNSLFTQLGIPASRKVFDTSDTPVLYFWAGETKPIEFIPALLAAEGPNSCFHTDGQGVHHFEGRQYRNQAARSIAVQWYLHDSLQTSDPPTGKPIYHSPPTVVNDRPDTIRNLIKGTVQLRRVSSVGQVWAYGGQLDIPGGESRTIYATFDEPVKDAIVPVVTTDYTLTGAISSTVLGATSGIRIPITFTASGGGASLNGPAGQESDGVYLRAKSLDPNYSTELVNTEDTTASKNRYLEQEHVVNAWPELNPNIMLDNLNNIAIAYKDPRDQVTVRVFANDYAHILMIMLSEISDRIHIKHTKLGIDHDFFIETKQIVLEGNNNMWGVFGCERAVVTTDDTLRFGSVDDNSKIGPNKLGG